MYQKKIISHRYNFSKFISTFVPNNCIFRYATHNSITDIAAFGTLEYTNQDNGFIPFKTSKNIRKL